MSLPRKRKKLAILCRPEVLDRMDLSDMWTTDPSGFTTEQNALWDALDELIAAEDNDAEAVSAVNAPVESVTEAMAAI